MTIKGDLFSTQKMLATTRGDVFYKDEKIVARSDNEKIGKTIEMLAVEVDQQKY